MDDRGEDEEMLLYGLVKLLIIDSSDQQGCQVNGQHG